MTLPIEKFSFENSALLIIDQQVKFCSIAEGRGNTQTQETAQRIAQQQPLLSNLVSSTYFIHSNRLECADKDIDFYKINPFQDQNNIIKRKSRDSAFLSYQPDPYIPNRLVDAEGDFTSQLRDMGLKRLVLCGFNLHACIAATALDACKRGFDVTILGDLVENDSTNRNDIYTSKGHSIIKEMHNNCIRFIHSEKLIEYATNPNAVKTHTELSPEMRALIYGG